MINTRDGLCKHTLNRDMIINNLIAPELKPNTILESNKIIILNAVTTVIFLNRKLSTKVLYSKTFTLTQKYEVSPICFFEKYIIDTFIN